MKAIFLILAESEHLEGVIEAWRKVGLTGVTILDSFGGGESLHRHEAEDSLPIFGSMLGYLRSRRPRSYTLISIAEEDRLVDQAIQAVETVVGDLSERGKGILFVASLDKVIGYRHIKK